MDGFSQNKIERGFLNFPLWDNGNSQAAKMMLLSKEGSTTGFVKDSSNKMENLLMTIFG
jgi:hypothetical protein